MIEKKKRGAKSGDNRFKRVQEERIESTLVEINSVLDLLRVRRVSFRNISHLASYVAAVITEKRGGKEKQMATSTLLRSNKYRLKLDGFLISVNNFSYEKQFEKLITDLELKELEDLRAENKRLSRFIEKNLGDIASEQPLNQPNLDSHQALSQLGRTISLLVEASDGQFVIDSNTGEIVNIWARSKKNRVIVSSKIAKPYIEWQKSFPAIGLIESQLKPELKG